MDPMSHPETAPAHTGGGRVVVGVDGSPDSIAALRAGEWAAAAQGGTLVAVTSWGVPMIVPRAPVVIPDLGRAARQLLHTALDEAFEGRCLVPIDTVVRMGRPATVLVEESRDADLLIVGSRGHGGFVGLMMGSVSLACAMHAPCPVLVMHGGDTVPQGSASRVVVGVGGSPETVSVLRAAADAADRMDARLDAVAAWSDAAMYGDAWLEDSIDLEKAAQEVLDDAIATAFPEGRPPRLHSSLRRGSPAQVLVDASATADLVVVGRAGRREFAGVLLGSVAMPVAAHAKSPVLVVPVPRAAEQEHAGADLAEATA